jgi:hypothetical protein
MVLSSTSPCVAALHLRTNRTDGDTPSKYIHKKKAPVGRDPRYLNDLVYSHCVCEYPNGPNEFHNTNGYSLRVKHQQNTTKPQIKSLKHKIVAGVGHDRILFMGVPKTRSGRWGCSTTSALHKSAVVVGMSTKKVCKD